MISLDASADHPGSCDLFFGEELRTELGLPVLVYARLPQDKSSPVVVFFPGGGHLARVAYGYPNGHPTNFLDYWLKQLDCGLIALSPPSGHCLFPSVHPETTLRQFSEASAKIVCDLLGESVNSRSIAAVAWSMTGRTAIQFNQAASRLGLALEAFIALSATPPLPGLSPISVSETPPDKNGLRTFRRSSIENGPLQLWLTALSEQNMMTGSEIIPPEDYERAFVVNTPFNLHGEALRFHKGRIMEAPADALDDLGTLNYNGAPLAGLITSTARDDASHIIAGPMRWGLFNAQKILNWSQAAPVGSISGCDLQALASLVTELPKRLTRKVPGNHFFFLGESGARKCAEHILGLINDIQAVKKQVSEITDISIHNLQ